MNRDFPSLADKQYDLIVIGGGIFGICAAWDAALRGLSVALLERQDFSHATSGNCFKMVHGGIRYLQHGDLYRVRESCAERSVLLRIAPHLVRPLPIMIPTYGHGVKGKELLAAGAFLYDLITLDRNRRIADPQRHIPWARAISRDECLGLFPDLKKGGLTGAVLFHDGQMHSPARLALAFLRSALKAGAAAANYVAATGFLRDGDRVTGVVARDELSGGELEIRGKVVINAAGPWAQRLLGAQRDLKLPQTLTFSRDACFVVPRRLTGDCALAVQGGTKDPDAVLSRGRRHLFVAPWRTHTLVGVWHVVYDDDPDDLTVSAADLQTFIDEVNEAYPALQLTLQDVSMWNAGLTLFGDNSPEAKDLSYGKRSLVFDHARTHGVEGLLTLVGVRYTTARGVATKAVDEVFRKLGKNPPKSATAVTPVYGGDFENLDQLLREAQERRPTSLDAETIPALVQNHGSAYREVLRFVDEDLALSQKLDRSSVIKAEVVHAVRNEMAEKLEDVVFRRTDLGNGGYPGDTALFDCASLMAVELGWDESRLQREIEQTRAKFPVFAETGNKRATSPTRAGVLPSESAAVPLIREIA